MLVGANKSGAAGLMRGVQDRGHPSRTAGPAAAGITTTPKYIRPMVAVPSLLPRQGEARTQRR